MNLRFKTVRVLLKLMSEYLSYKIDQIDTKKQVYALPSLMICSEQSMFHTCHYYKKQDTF